MKPSDKPLVVLIGNPNCGKTTLFNQMTGLNKKTGNWSGVTVDSAYCAINFEDLSYDLVDLPGIYGLSLDSQGQDESHVHEFLIKHKPNIVINVINASALERGLFLTQELLNNAHTVINVLNMWDEAQNKGIRIDKKNLSKLLDSQVIAMVASKGQGVEELFKEIKLQLKKTRANKPKKQLSFEQLLQSSKQLNKKVSQQHKIPVKSTKLDFLSTHPVYGLLVFFLAMFVMFFFAINVSSVFVDFFDQASGAILIHGGHQFFDFLGFPQALVAVLADGVGGGIQTVSTFIPVIGFLYLLLTWLEDSGYMARAAFVMNGHLQKIGLSGQAFVPLIVSFGCNVPAIMATRTLSSKRERLVTILMAPFMSCGARLSVYALFVAAFFSHYAAAIVFALYFTGIVMAVLTGLLLKKTLLPGKAEPFIIELPPWRIPTLKNLLIGTWTRLKGFLLGAGKVIIVMVMLIQLINSVGKDGSWGNQDSENSLLSVTAKAIVPVFKPMGLDERNWPALVGILTGVLAKEVVVGTLDALYSSLDENKDVVEQASIKEELMDAVKSIKVNAMGLSDLIFDPLGLSITAAGTEQEMAEKQAVSESIFGIIRDRFQDKYAAFAYLLFILLYLPCVATSAAISREANIKWALFSGAWSTGLAYLTATNFYQLSHYSQHPLSSSLWLASYILVIIAVYFSLKKIGQRRDSIALYIQDS